MADAKWTRAGWYRIEVLPGLKLIEGPLAGRKACLKTLGAPQDDNVMTCARLAKQGAEVDVALAFFADAIKANPKDAKAMNHRGLLFAQRGQYDRAIDEHTAAIEAAPGDIWAYVFRGTLYQKIKQPKEAEADFRAALALNPADKRLVEKLKTTLREMGVEP
jgi:Flp pilus assembly protein TadD